MKLSGLLTVRTLTLPKPEEYTCVEMRSFLERARVRGQAMVETFVVSFIILLMMLAFGGVVTAFLDYGYRTFRLVSMEIF